LEKSGKFIPKKENGAAPTMSESFEHPTPESTLAPDGEQSEAERRRDRHDEWIAAILALLGIGSILWWIVGPRLAGDTNWALFKGSINQSPVRSSANGDEIALNPGGLKPGETNPGGSAIPGQGNAAIAPPATGSPAPDQGNPPPANPPQLQKGEPPSFAPSGQGALNPAAGAAGAAATLPSLNAALKPNASPSNAPSSAPTASEAPKPVVTGFEDVKPDYWAAPYINGLAQKGILQGLDSKNFNPDAPVTRAQFAAMLQQAFERQPSKPPIAFSDIPANHWATKSIDEAVQTGFMNGYPNGQFLPDRQIPRVEGVVALTTGLATPPDASVSPLKGLIDGNQIPAYAKPKVSGAITSGLLVNYPDVKQFNPTQPMTRADAAALIYQALAKEGKVNPVPSEFIVNP
jgi:hypothetical protein